MEKGAPLTLCARAQPLDLSIRAKPATKLSIKNVFDAFYAFIRR
jgi:hypothetical protein